MTCTDTEVLQGQAYRPIVTVTKTTAVDTDTGSATYNPEGRIDITGLRFRSSIRKRPDHAFPVLASLDSDNAGEFTILTQTPLPFVTGSTLGQLQPNYSPTQTDGLAYGRYYVDVWMLEGVDDWQPIVAPFPVFIREGTTEPLT